ncbi:hypothetical protein ACTWPT_17845 [Nonomuraea sp. 3N208]|uniref:hypothetical protein n=1 Tax=Nonomuraea sp. 3N208 TaxID=3457421 RepID=UPI003FCED307
MNGDHDARGTHLSRGLAALALTAVALDAAAGCSWIRGCAETRLQVEPLHVTDTSAPVTLTARLTTDDGRPVARARIHFFARIGAPGEQLGEQIGDGITDADGVASLVRRDGVAGLVLPGKRVVGYSAQFATIGEVGGKDYCWTEATAPIT